jgi:hypothetical protein
MKLNREGYTPWKYSCSFQRPTYGSKWYYGNFTIGLQYDSHPRFTNLILSFWWIELVISRERSHVQEYKMSNGFAVQLKQHADNPITKHL